MEKSHNEYLKKEASRIFQDLSPGKSNVDEDIHKKWYKTDFSL
jgi:hypothetical protein